MAAKQNTPTERLVPVCLCVCVCVDKPEIKDSGLMGCYQGDIMEGVQVRRLPLAHKQNTCSDASVSLSVWSVPNWHMRTT